MQFIVNRIRKSPIQYSIIITHFVSHGEWKQSAKFNDVKMQTEEDREKVMADLRHILEQLEATKQQPTERSE